MTAYVSSRTACDDTTVRSSGCGLRDRDLERIIGLGRQHKGIGVATPMSISVLGLQDETVTTHKKSSTAMLRD